MADTERRTEVPASTTDPRRRGGRFGRLLCRLSIHGPRPPVLYGDDPWPIRFRCARCGIIAVDYGPEH